MFFNCYTYLHCNFVYPNTDLVSSMHASGVSFYFKYIFVAKVKVVVNPDLYVIINVDIF